MAWLRRKSTNESVVSSEGRAHNKDVRAAIETVGAAALLSAAGCYVVACKVTDEMPGTMVLNRRGSELPGHVQEGGSELELTYVFRPHAWGNGYAFEAARALLRCATG